MGHPFQRERGGDVLPLRRSDRVVPSILGVPYLLVLPDLGRNGFGDGGEIGSVQLLLKVIQVSR
jgi:hypothetical protein